MKRILLLVKAHAGIAVASLALALTACAPEKQSRSPGLQAGLDDPGQGGETDTACMNFLPNLAIDVRVAAFEMLDEASLGLGWPASQILNPVVSLEVKFVHGRMDLVFEARNPLTPSGGRTARGIASLNKFSAEAKVNLPQLVLDPSYVYRTPLAEVAVRGLTDGTKNIETETRDVEWQSSVKAIVGSRVVIDAGEASGIKVGDQFSIHTAQRYWVGEPCKGEYLGTVRDPAPIAVIEVDSVPQLGTTSFAKILSGELSAIEINDDVIVKKLKGGGLGPARALKKAVRLGDVIVENIALPDGSNLSLETAMRVLARDVLKSSFWPKY